MTRVLKTKLNFRVHGDSLSTLNAFSNLIHPFIQIIIYGIFNQVSINILESRNH